MQKTAAFVTDLVTEGATETATEIVWYFDFVSPYAYLQHYRLMRHVPALNIRYVPALLGALLQHYETKGPAEIPAKRLLTYRYCQWYANQKNIPFRFPVVHPFKPLVPLRLALACACEPRVITQLFHTIWVEGQDLNQPETLAAFAQQQQIESVETLIQQPAIKQALRTHTEAARDEGVFGIPTIKINDVLFWGEDSTDMALHYLADPQLFTRDEYRYLEAIQSGI